MGYIKEPKGIDFIISSDPLTDEARQEISLFISNYKSDMTNKIIKLSRSRKKSKVVKV